ncbi:MAG: hypothetical protein P4M07_04555 [Xanthobacteraceae bacterium]|nr:hypothetical protein [Xanthobacteraceae bacterium]
MSTSTTTRITLTSHGRRDGTWYVEVMRPGIVSEHIGDFVSKASAEAWIRANTDFYVRRHAARDASGGPRR